MSMGVQSYPELFTILLGWDLYGKLWTLLTETGLAFLPFIGIILKNMSKTYVIHGVKGSAHALREMEIQLLTTILIILFAVVPFIPLTVETVAYTPMCGDTRGTPLHAGTTGTTYDKAFLVPDGDIRVPLWWYAVIAISEGITSSANTMVGCVPDLRKMISEVNMTKLTDAELVNQIKDFAAMCYVPARVQYFQDTRENNIAHLDQIKQSTDKYGIEDTEWMGSHAFNEVYYANLKATRPIPGFQYVANDDINHDTNSGTTPAYGTPRCDTWWNSPENGLKDRVYRSLPLKFDSEFKDYINDDESHDSLIKSIISSASSGGLAGYQNANATIGDFGYSHLVSAIGILTHQVEEYPKLYAAAEAAPIIQALMLLMTYVFLPFAFVFSAYAPRAILTASIFIFSLIFWGFIWHLVSWADKALMSALYTNWFASQGAGATLADMIMGALVIIAPLFWFFFMGVLGIMAGAAIGGITGGMSDIADTAAKGGANQAANLTQAAIKASITSI